MNFFARYHVISAIACLLLVAPAKAGPETDLLFATPHLDNAPGAQLIAYERSTRRFDAEENALVETEERIEMSVAAAADGAARAIDVVVDPDGRARSFDTFTGVPGNPMLMVFLEGVVRSLQEATGGSPFYLRNRIRGALADGLARAPAEGAGDLLVTRPFESDRNRHRMGPFADLELRFHLAPDAPGMLTQMTAEARYKGAEAYFEEIRLAPSL
ncbi:MAG: hypothetical protein AAF360_14435 [Pseudomonadota bacterium]